MMTADQIDLKRAKMVLVLPDRIALGVSKAVIFPGELGRPLFVSSKCVDCFEIHVVPQHVAVLVVTVVMLVVNHDSFVDTHLDSLADGDTLEHGDNKK